MKIVFKGTEYDGPETMPAEVRAAYEAALALARHGGAKLPGVQVKVNVKRRVVYNGVEYEDTDQLPEQAREALEQQGGLGALAGRALPRRSSTPAERWAIAVLGTALLAGLLLFTRELQALEFTFDDGRLFVWGGGFGVAAGALLLLRILPGLRLPSLGRAVYALMLVLALAFGGTGLACLANRQLARGQIRSWSFTITDKIYIPQHFHGYNTDTWAVRAEANGRRLRMDVPPSLWQRLEIGHSYTGTVRQGYLGYPFLSDAGLR